MANSKIIGFILSPQKIDYLPKIATGVNVKLINIKGGFLSVYFYGKLDDCITKTKKYSMGYPVSDNLNNHNLLISLESEAVVIENDWLASIPVFYNENIGIISSFPKVCLRDNKTIDNEGILSYLKYGFNVYGNTPFKEVKFAMFCSRITYFKGKISITSVDDPVLKIDKYKGSSESQIWNDIREYIQYCESHSKGKIVLPISGGLDSRIISYFIKDKSRVRAFSYGISANQEKSFEVEMAKKVAEKLNLDWMQIKLSKAFSLYNEWHDLYAYSTHLHGMIHIEMYDEIKKKMPKESLSMVSGICGGVFTGSNEYTRVSSPKGLYNLAFTHGLNFSLKSDEYSFEQEKWFLEKYSYLFEDLRLYPVITMRIKLMILSYLLTIPSAMGIPAWTPFLNFDIVMKMLNLPVERRRGRGWVKEFFKAKNIEPSKNVFFQHTTNRLNFNLHKDYSFDPLSDDFKIPYLSEREKSDINSYLKNIDLGKEMNHYLTTTRIVKELLKKIGVENKFSSYITDYQTLKAIEMSLIS